MGLGDIEFRKKYPGAVYLLCEVIKDICDANELKTTIPAHTLAPWIFTIFFIEDEKEGD